MPLLLYLTLHLRHLSGELDLRGVGQLRVQGGRRSFNQPLRAIIQLREGGQREIDHISHKAHVR